MNLEIRPLGPADAAALALAGQATFLESYAHVLEGEDIVFHCAHEHGQSRYADWLGQPGCDFWGAFALGGAIVGYVMLCPPDLPVSTGPGDLEIKRIYLLSRFHGGGVGAALMEAALAAARRRGARRVLLGVYRENAAALGFYARQGFVQAGVRTFRVGARTYDDLVLARDL